MSRFNKKVSTKTVNLAGGISYKRPLKEELVFAVLSTFLENKFYESGDERVERIKDLISEVDHEFVAKLAIVARKEFHMRSVSHLLLGELSKIHKGDSLVQTTIVQATERPDDLLEIMAYTEGIKSHQVRKGLAKAIEKFNAYQLAKYKGTGKFKLVDLFNLVHPSGNRKEWKELMTGTLKSPETWEVLLSSGKNKGQVWKQLISEEKIGYMALLRNLRNIDKQADKETKKAACKIISDKEAVKKSKQLPFRFYNAYLNVENQEMLKAISKAMDISLENVPKFEGKTLIAVDSSGSMDGDPIQKASIFAAALAKSNDADLILYDTEVKKLRYLTEEPILTLAEKIQREANGGGTDTSQVFIYAEEKGIKYERIIILSDNESWIEGHGTKEEYLNYKEFNDCFVYCVDIQGYGTKDISGGKVFHMCGWSDRLLDFIKFAEQGNTIVKYIEDYELHYRK